MSFYGIEQFVGTWISASGYCLRIKKVCKNLASVSFLIQAALQVQRPYMGGAASIKTLVAHYDDYYGDFDVELWEKRRFILHLSREYQILRN